MECHILKIWRIFKYMALIDTLNYYLRLIFIIAIVVLGAVAAALYYLLKVKKITARKEIIDHDSFNRRDALEYVKFENIVSGDDDTLKGPGVVVVGNNTFVAGLNVTGYNFSTASAGERERTMVNAISFGNVIEEPIQFRQTVKSVDLSYNIQVYQDALEKQSLEGMELQEEYDSVVGLLDKYQDNPEELAAVEKKLKTLQKALRAKHHAVKEVQNVIHYMETMVGGSNKDSQKINQILFSYKYNPDEYTEELTKEEIVCKAYAELSTKANTYANAMSRCGCSCKRITASELVLLMHKHCHPVSADEMKMEDIFDSSYNALYISSDSLAELEMERIGEEEFNRRLEQYYAEQQELLNKQDEDALRETMALSQDVASMVQSQVGFGM